MIRMKHVAEESLHSLLVKFLSPVLHPHELCFEVACLDEVCKKRLPRNQGIASVYLLFFCCLRGGKALGEHLIRAKRINTNGKMPDFEP